MPGQGVPTCDLAKLGDREWTGSMVSLQYQLLSIQLYIYFSDTHAWYIQYMLFIPPRLSMFCVLVHCTCQAFCSYQSQKFSAFFSRQWLEVFEDKQNSFRLALFNKQKTDVIANDTTCQKHLKTFVSYPTTRASRSLQDGVKAAVRSISITSISSSRSSSSERVPRYWDRSPCALPW